jgi:hypothetical protein
MERRETKQSNGRRSVAALLTLTGTLLWTVPVVQGEDAAGAANFRFVRVAKVGGLAPGGGGLTYNNLAPHDVNKRGDALWVAYTGSYPEDAGIYVRSPSGIRNIVLDTDDYVYDPLGHVAMNDSGDVAFGETVLTYFEPPMDFTAGSTVTIQQRRS